MTKLDGSKIWPQMPSERKTMPKATRLLIAAAAALGMTTLPVQAELLDPPYFNLWTGTGSNGEQGHGNEVALCGTAACSGAATPTTLTSDWAIFRTVESNYGKGSGAIDPFLRFHHNEGSTATGSQTWEAAFNTDYRSTSNPVNTGKIQLDGTQFDPDLTTGKGSKKTTDVIIDNQAKDHSHFNYALMLGDLRAAMDSDGYLHFLLDINEPGGSKATLRLDELAFFVASSNTMSYLVQDKSGDTGAALGSVELWDSAAKTQQATKVWDMDFASIGGLMLDNINSSGPAGSGDYDMRLLLAASLFEGYADTDYVYLYNFMGAADKCTDALGCEADAGFEEWAFDRSVAGPPPPPGVPEPTTLLLLGVGLVGALGHAAKARRHR